MHDPKAMVSWFKDDDDAAYVSEDNAQEIARFINYIKCAKLSGLSTVEIHYSKNIYELKVGSLINSLDYEKKGTLSSEEFKNTKITITISNGFGSSPSELFLGYKDLLLNIGQVKYSGGGELQIASTNGKMIFSTPIGTGTETNKQIFDWLQYECGFSSEQPGAIHVDNSATLKAKDIFLFSTCELEQISRGNRETLIKELLAEQENWAGFDKDTYQYLLVNILKTIPPGDKSYFYKLFESTPSWFSYLYNNMASSQRDKLMKILLELWYNQYNGDIELIKQKAKHAFIITNSMLGNAKNHLTFSELDEVVFTTPEVEITEFGGQEYDEELFRTPIFEPIFLNLQGDKSEKPFAILPAFCIKYYTDKGNLENVKDAMKVTVNVALFAVGVGEVINGIRGAILIARTSGIVSTKFLGSILRVSLGVTDLAASVTSEYCKIGANGNSDFCHSWKEYEFYVNMGLLTASVSDLLYTNLSKSYTSDVRKGLIDQGLQKEVDFIEKELGILAKGAGKYDEILSGLKTNTSLQEHLFKGDYKKLTGCHYFDAVDNVNVRFADASKLETNSFGVVKGDIEMLQPKLNSRLEVVGSEWKLKPTGKEPQTFFPKDWSKDKILEECASALDNTQKSLVPNYSRMYHAQSKSGVWIRWFEDADGNVKSIFPEF